jgi:hypothetical protein
MAMYTPVNAYNTIKVKKYSDVIEEYTAYAAITPGNFVEIYSADGYVRKHSTEGGNCLPMIALEDELQGKGIDDDYAAGDKVQCWIPYRGDQGYVLLEDGETIVIGDWLMTNGSGRVQKLDAETLSAAEALSVVAQALEALDLSGSSGVETTNRLLVRFV